MALSYSGLLEGDSRDLWDDFWKGHGSKVMASWAKRRMIKIMSDCLRPGNSVLDAGCGSGFFSSYFISCGCDVYSLDYSGQALSIAKDITQAKSKAYIKGNILDERRLLDIGRRFDIIFTDGLLEHYREKEQDRIIQNLKALKKEKGLIITFAPNRFSFWSIIRPFYIAIKENPFLMSEFLNLHTRNGLEIRSYGGINVVPFRISPERLLGRYIGMLFHCVAV